MHVQGNSPYGLLLKAYKAHTARQTSNDDAPTKNGTTAPVSDESAKAVTGVVVSRLSPETVGYAIQASQQTDSSEVHHPLPSAIQRWMDNIANNPEYARKQAEELGRSGNAVIAKTPPNGASASKWTAFTEKLNNNLARAEDVRQQREAYYETLKSQGLPSAKIYAKLLEFNTKLPESYGNGLDLTGAAKNGWWQTEQRARLNYLQQAVSQANDAQS